VSGLGFGIISGAFSLVNVLGDMAGPGSLGIYGDSQYFFLVTCMKNIKSFLKDFLCKNL
jgi:gamma-secretase subunit APH-1